MARKGSAAALVLFLSLGGQPGGVLFGQQPTVPAPTQEVDGGWPREYTTASKARLVLYQPQIASWANQKRITAYAAVAYSASGAAKPALGTIKIEADTSVSITERLVSFT